MYDHTDSFYGFHIAFGKDSRKSMRVIAYREDIVFYCKVVKGAPLTNSINLSALAKAMRDYKYGVRGLPMSKYLRFVKTPYSKEYMVSAIGQCNTVEANFTTFSKFLYNVKADTGIDFQNWVSYCSRRKWFQNV